MTQDVQTQINSSEWKPVITTDTNRRQCHYVITLYVQLYTMDYVVMPLEVQHEGDDHLQMHLKSSSP